jgi:hypothetical protein
MEVGSIKAYRNIISTFIATGNNQGDDVCDKFQETEKSRN